MPKALLTPLLIKQTACPADKTKCDLLDSNCKGLVVEIRCTGGKTYYLRYQDSRGRTRQLKIANEGDVSLSQARQMADKARTKIAMGEDPPAGPHPDQDHAEVRPLVEGDLARCG